MGEDRRERDFYTMLRNDIAAIAQERADQAKILTPNDCADLVKAFHGLPLPESLAKWVVTSLQDGRNRGQTRRRLKDEAVLRAARRDYRRYCAWLQKRNPNRYRVLGRFQAKRCTRESRERAIAMVRRKYGSDLKFRSDAGSEVDTLERYLRGK